MSRFEMEVGATDELTGLAHPDPVVLELNRLQNQLKGLILTSSSSSVFGVCAD